MTVFGRWLGGIVIFSLIGFGGWNFYHDQDSPETETLTMETFTVSKGNIQNKLTGERGLVELAGQMTIKAPSEGIIEEILVKLGDNIPNGQSLFLLKNTQKESDNFSQNDYQYKLATQELIIKQKKLQLEEAKNNLENAKSNFNRQKQRGETLEKIELQKKQGEIEQKKISWRQKNQKVAQSKQEVRDAQEKLIADENLWAKGYIPEDQLKAQKRNVSNAQSTLQDAEMELKQDNLELAQLQLELQNLQENIREKLTENQENIRQAKQQIIDAEKALKQAEYELELALIELEKIHSEGQKTTNKNGNKLVTAPLNGKIIDLMVKKGDVVKLGDELLTIGNPNNELIKLQLSILNAPKVKPLQLANITMIGPNAKTFTGKIETVSLLAKKDANASFQQVTVAAIVKLDQPTGVLIPGSAVNVDIILQEKKNVLILPLSAMQNEGGENFVWVKNRENKAMKKPVTLGLESLSEVEIISGLQEGEEILLPSPDQILEEGMLIE